MRSMTERGNLPKTNQQLLENARKLRKQLTPQERKLWYEYLRNHEFHWYKQKVLDRYILDFYCPRIKLALELDGSQHYSEEGIKYDKRRTEYLQQQGIDVLRIINPDIDKNFESVCNMIDEYCKRYI